MKTRSRAIPRAPEAEVVDQHRAAQQAPAAAYPGNAYRLRALGDRLGARIACPDRCTIESDLARPLSDTELATLHDHFGALHLVDHAGEHGGFRTDRVEPILKRAAVGGRVDAASGRSATVRGARGTPITPAGRCRAASRSDHDRTPPSGAEIGW